MRLASRWVFVDMSVHVSRLMTSTISVTLPLWAETNLLKLAFVCVYDVKICACVIEGQVDGYAIHETLTALTHPLSVHQK